MNFGRYQLLTPLGAGADGVAYRAEVAGSQPVEHVELRVLSGAAGNSERWQQLGKRLRIATHLQHPNAIAVRDHDLGHNPPYIVLEWLEPANLAQQLATTLPLSPADVVALSQQLAGLLAAAHRLGLSHAELWPGVILGSVACPRLDFTGTQVTTAAEQEPFAVLAASCRAPEEKETARLDAPWRPESTIAGNLYSLGATLFWLLTGEPADNALDASLSRQEVPLSLRRLVLELLAVDPDIRPSARDVRDRLIALCAPAGETGVFPTRTVAGTPVEEVPSTAATVHDKGARKPAAGTPPAQLGRYRLLEKIGQGGMGAVYRAEDVSDGSVVALKVLRPDWAANPNHLRRFHKEARLLAEVNNPHVANLLEVNEDNGIHYLALEYVAGTTLGHWLQEHGRLGEKAALALLADVARGLAPAHAAGIIHRDIKPENILLASGGCKPPVPASTGGLHPPLAVKLSDFGLARHIVETESLNMTRAGAVLGTPLYMSPEQCAGRAVDARADVYSLGATLYHMLAGRPPFEAATVMGVIAMHGSEPLPPLQKFNPAVSEAVCRVIDKTMAKSAEARYPDAAALLEDLERLLRGEPSSIAVHPRLPQADPARVLAYDFSWELESSPALLWPHVSNTERLNRALGLSAVRFSMETVAAGSEPADSEASESAGSKPAPTAGKRVRRMGRFHKAGLLFAWEEHPFEWIEARRMGVLREYSSGPFRWLVSIVELEPRPGCGTTLHHRLRLEPRNLIGRTLAAVEIGLRVRRSLGLLYRRIDHFLIAQSHAPAGPRPYADPFEEPGGLPRARRKRLAGLLQQLADLGVEAAIVEGLGDFLATAPAQEVARIRPLALSRRLGLDPDKLTAACLHGARLGLLVLLWDILCPVCRIPSEVKETLRELREHGHCEACQIDFELDFANSVEMIFRAHPEIRDNELATYCVGGPAHSPHVAAQARLAPGERIELDLALGEGAYRLRGPQLAFTLDFRVEAPARAARWDLVLSRPPPVEVPRVLRAGSQLLALTNDTDRELLVRVERTAPRADALTAARASSLALFRDLFPGEALSPGQLISVTTLTFLVTDLVGSTDLYRDLGDARAFNFIHEYFRLAQESIVKHCGALVKTVGEGMLAVFSDATAAVRVALGLQGLLAGGVTTKGLRVRVGVHRGPALAATLNDRLDYFGATISEAMRLPGLVRGGEVVLTEAVASDPRVAALLQGQGLSGTVLGNEEVFHCFTAPGG